MALHKPSDLFGRKKVEENKLPVAKSDNTLREELSKVESLSEQLQQLQQDITQKVVKSDLESLVLSQINTMQENFEILQREFKQSHKSDLNHFKKIISDVTEIVNHLVEDEIPKYKKQITSNEVRFGNQLKDFKEEVEDKVQNFYQVLNEFNDVVQVIDTVSNIEKYLQEHHQDLITLREEVFAEIEQIPVGNIQENLNRLEKKIDFIHETYSTIDPETVAKEIIQEGLLNEPSEIKNEDPLTSLDQNFVTLDQLQEHYRLFINRIQQQLSTFGGGGETQLKYLDDIVGIATNPGSYNGKFLKYDHSLGKFVFDDPAGGGGGGSGDYANVAGIATYASIAGVATYSQVSGVSTYASTAGISTYASVSGLSTFSTTAGYASTAGISTLSQGLTGTPSISVDILEATDALFTGNISILGDFNKVDSNGIITARSGLTIGIPEIPDGTKTILSANGSASFAGIVTSSVSIPTELRTRSVAEKTTLVSGNTVGLAFTAGGGNVAICTNPTGDITLNVTNIPTDSSFDNHSISFSVIVTQTGTARTCTTVNLNGVSRTIRWAGGSLSNAISGVTTSSGYDIFTFTGINTVGSASTTANYVILGSVNGGFN